MDARRHALDAVDGGLGIGEERSQVGSETSEALHHIRVVCTRVETVQENMERIIDVTYVSYPLSLVTAI